MAQLPRQPGRSTQGSSARPGGPRRLPVGELRLHRCAELVPAMSGPEYAAFLSDVRARGVLEPLTITRDRHVLDGRHRLRAARELRLDDVPVRVIAVEDPRRWVIHSALQRRHLSQSQKAALAVELEHDQLQQARTEAARRRNANLRNRVESATLPTRQQVRQLAANIAGVSERTMQDVLTVHAHDQALFAQIKGGQIPAHTARLQLQRQHRYGSLAPAPPLPRRRFELIYADPPWQLGNPDSDYAPEQYYPTLPLDQIAELDVPAADDALLYLWAVNSHLPDALVVMEAWGFVYRGCEVWIKPSIGMGVWTRNRHELLLIGRKGSASPAPRRLLLDSVIEAHRGAHSEKPVVVYDRLELLYPERSKLELYARGRPRKNWTAWGNQLDTQQAA